MPGYCVNTAALKTGEHIVHRMGSNCTLLPEAKRRTDLGSLLDDEAAIYEANRKFVSVDGCPKCMTKHSALAMSDETNAAILAAISATNI